MGDNSESLDGAVIMLIVSDWQINVQKKLTNMSWHGNSMSQNRLYNAGKNIKCCRVN
jgi:hypothetical protein